MAYLRKILLRMYYIYSLCKIVLLSLLHKKRIYIFGTPIHGNLGDQAILVAEREFLKDNIPNVKLIEVESFIVEKFGNAIQKVIGNSTILITGGGFLGSLWMNEENMFRKTLKMFPNNVVIVMPQTIYFSSDDEGKKVLMESKEIYTAHKKLYICCREKYSFDLMKKEFPKCNLLLIPDMVLYLNGIINDGIQNNVLFCIRQDKEKINYEFDELKSFLSDYNIDYTDTVISKNVYGFNRKSILNKKIKQFSKYKLIVTDRLHGMVFSLLAGVPCLVFENKSYKVKGVYNWISGIDRVRLYNENNLKTDVTELLKLQRERYTNLEIKTNYEPLVDLIKRTII